MGENVSSDDRRSSPDLGERIRSGDAGAFEELFRTHYASLCRFAHRYVRDGALAWLTWDGGLGARLRMRSVASIGALDWHRLGEPSARSLSVTRVDDARSLRRIGVRQDWTLDAHPRLVLKWGVDAKRESVRYDYFSVMSVRTRGGAGTDTTDTTAVAIEPRTNKLALYFAPRVRLLSSLTLEVGVRYDRNSHIDESVTSPRVNLSWEPSAGTTMRAAWGRYSQSQALFGLQAEDGVSTFDRARRAEQRVLGLEQALPFGLTGRVEAYERRLTTARSEFANVGGDILLFPELSWDRVRIDRQGGRDRGLELQASRANGQRMDWSVSYALASSRDSVGGRMVPRAFDQRHAVHFDWSMHPASNSWRLSIGGVRHSGWPYTPTNVAIDTLASTPTRFSVRVERTPGELNALRLRSYRRIDARWTRYIDTARGRVSVFGEVYNLFDTENVRGLFEEVNVNGRIVSRATTEITQWPRLPIAGFTWEF